MVRPAFIVEGFQEKKIVQKLCPGCIIKRLEVNGKYVSLAKVALGIQRHIDSLANRHYPIVVLFDREGRAESSEIIIKTVREELKKFQTEDFVDKMIFGVPDRKFESWILPFIDKEGNFIESPSPNHEGNHSLGELESRLMKSNLIYSKTQLGVSYFLKVDPVKLCQVSDSFKFLFEGIKDLSCRWHDGS